MSRIIVIEDDPLMREMIMRTLERAGYDVLGASHGNEALKIQKENPVDLILTDIIMPEKNGLETITEFRRLFPAVKVIAISGGGKIGADEYLHIAKALGAQKTLRKPFNSKALLEAVREVLE